MIEDGFPDRYWVNLGPQSVGNSKNDIEYNVLISALSNRYKNLQYTYVTWDFKDAIDVANKVIDANFRFFNLKKDECGVSIYTQPKCPNCGYFGRFSEENCTK